MKKDFSYALNETGDFRESWRIFRIMAEFVEGYQFLSTLKKEVTVFGSARLAPGSAYYTLAEKLGALLSGGGFTTITGGGPGIMEAANKGAFEAGGESVGLNIQLPFEQRINPYVKKSIAFYYFFTRKVMLSSPANAFVFFPGGFGTMDEFFEMADLMELGKMHKSPVILVGSEYWNPILDFLKSKSCALGCAPDDMVASWHVVDTADSAYELIRDLKDNHHLCELSSHSFYCREDKIDWKIFRIMAELVEGFQFLTGVVEDVTVLGSNNIPRDSDYYNAAHALGGMLADAGFAVVTGGGEGIMEAANKGAFEKGGESLGVTMRFGYKERINSFVKRSIGFQFPFTRKLILTAPSKAFVFFPGGLGTLHQLFEILTLIQTEKMPPLPVFLFNSDFWSPLDAIIRQKFADEFRTIDTEDYAVYEIVDDLSEIVDKVRKFRDTSGR